MLEPRSFPRADVDMPATVALDEERIAGRVVNISEVGALVVVSTAFEPGVELSLTVTLVPGDAPTTVRAKVVRSTEAGLRRHAVAVAFRVSAVAAETIREIVERTNRMAWDGSPGRIPREVAVRLVPMIRRVARGIAHRLPPQVSIDDLVGAGFVALVELYAANPNASVADLERIAMPRIRWAMLDELRNSDPLSRRMRQRARRISKAARDLHHKLGRKPTDVEVAQSLKLSMKAYEAALKLAQTGEATSIDASDDFELADQRSVGPEDQVSRTETLNQLKLAMNALPPRLRKILELYYGDEHTLRQIGNILGVTEARISQLLSDAVKRLRVSCVEKPADSTRRKSSRPNPIAYAA